MIPESLLVIAHLPLNPPPYIGPQGKRSWYYSWLMMESFMPLCKITQLFSASQLLSVMRIIWQATSTGNCGKIIYQGVITAYLSTNKSCRYLFATIFNTYSDPCHFCFISETKSVRKQVPEKKRSVISRTPQSAIIIILGQL